MSEIDVIDVCEGNTKTSQSPMRKRWCMTLNNYTEFEYLRIKKTIDAKSKVWIIGKEVGESGTPHLQIYLELRKQGRFTELKKWNPRLHIEPAKGSRLENLKYCSKEEFVSSERVPRALDKVTYEELKDQQKDFIQKYLLYLCPKYDRKIVWAWEKKGGWGKTQLTKYLVDNYCLSAVVVPVKTNDAFYLIKQYIEVEGEGPDIVIIDVPRCSIDYINYQAIEKIKDGICACGKYESLMLRFNTPHVVVFCNEEPDYQQLSKDRWQVEPL